MDIDLQNDRITQIQFDTQNQNNNLSFLKDKMGIMKEEETEFDKFIKYLYEQYQQKKGISDTTSNLMSFIDPHAGLGLVPFRVIRIKRRIFLYTNLPI